MAGYLGSSGQGLWQDGATDDEDRSGRGRGRGVIKCVWPFATAAIVGL
jgi:hypothetical protein